MISSKKISASQSLNCPLDIFFLLGILLSGGTFRKGHSILFKLAFGVFSPVT